MLSFCGIFIALYETSVMRDEARGSVWPHAEATASIRDGSMRVWVQNNGVGPARVRNALLTHDGETVQSWGELSHRLGGDLDADVPLARSVDACPAGTGSGI